MPFFHAAKRAAAERGLPARRPFAGGVYCIARHMPNAPERLNERLRAPVKNRKLSAILDGGCPLPKGSLSSKVVEGAADRRRGGARHDGPDEVARIGRVHGDALTGARKLANMGKLLDRLRQRELLAAESGDEPAAAHEPAVFETP